MRNLPPLNKINSSQKITLPELDSLDPKLRRQRILDHFQELDPRFFSEDDFKVESRYREMLNASKNPTSKDVEEKYIEELKNLGLYEISKLEEAIENSELDLGKYNIVIMSKIIKKLEKTRKLKDLNSFPILSLDDFYDLVAEGEIEIEKYDVKEVEIFIDNLIKKNNLGGATN